jgi:hypothetical protein
MYKPEITWSLMHPTALDVNYMRRVVEKSKEYNVDSFEICAACHSLYGGMDSFLLYEDFPTAAKHIDKELILKNRETFNEILDLAHSVNKPVYYWHREVMVPNGLLEDVPELIDEDGEFDLLGEAFKNLIRYKIQNTFKAVPKLDGLVLTLTESEYSVIHNSNAEKFPAQKVVAAIVDIFVEELTKLNKHFVLRSFGSIAQDYEDIIAGGAISAQKKPFEIETKITPYDFDPFLPINPFLRRVPNTTMGAECDCLGEFLGAGFLPSENVDNIVNYVKTGHEKKVDRYAIRLDRVCNNIFDCYEVNLYAYHRAIEDATVTADQIRKEWAEKAYPPEYREAFINLGLDGFSFVKYNNFVNGNVMFHQFPIRPDLKMIKAAYLFGFFKENVSLKMGDGVWSVLHGNRTISHAGIIAEKEYAQNIAKCALKTLEDLPVIPGYEKEILWRKKLWNNALIASISIGEFCKCVAAYFEDMASGELAPRRLASAAACARTVFEGLVGQEIEKCQEASFSNGMGGHNLFQVASKTEDVYVKPLAGCVDLLLEEFAAEVSAREIYLHNTFDGVILGGLYDDWKCRRYMHASHAKIEDKLPMRYAGNPVFPNGFFEVELARPVSGGKMTIYGVENTNNQFVVEFDDQRIEAQFDENNTYSIDIAPSNELLLVRISKVGNQYPAFRAITVTL